MSIKTKTKKFNIGTIGSVKIDLKVTKFIGGKGPKALIINGIHGDEYTGLLVVEKLLKKMKKLKGEVWVISSANPLAMVNNTRENPVDNLDLNRNFPGDMGQGLTQKLAATLLSIAKEADFVLDFHTFSDPTVVTGIFMNTGKKRIDAKMLSFLKLFDPDVAWRLNLSTKDEQKYTGALGPVLAFAGVPNIAIELPPAWIVSDEQIDRSVAGVLRILNDLGITRVPSPKESGDLNVINLKTTFSEGSGIFISKRQLLDKVKKGDVVGELVDLSTFSKKRIRAMHSGVLVILKHNHLVGSGDRLFAVGKQ